MNTVWIRISEIQKQLRLFGHRMLAVLCGRPPKQDIFSDHLLWSIFQFNYYTCYKFPSGPLRVALSMLIRRKYRIAIQVKGSIVWKEMLNTKKFDWLKRCWNCAHTKQDRTHHYKVCYQTSALPPSHHGWVLQDVLPILTGTE